MFKNIRHLSYHVIVVFLSAALAISMPFLLSAMARKLLASWSLVENEKMFLAGIEISIAVALILSFNLVMRMWNDRKLARMAKSAGLIQATPRRGAFLFKRKIKHMKERLGFARDIMIIGSTGYHSFVEPAGDLYEAVRNCREAKIMLIDPLKPGAVVRARSIPDPEITPAVIQDQIIRSIDYLKDLKAAQKNVMLKLYPDLPLLKMAILGDYAFVRHYHTGMNVRCMPEFAFRNEQNHGGLYLPLYRYFCSKWQDPAIPEYDLDRDELVYRDQAGSEVGRESFNETTMTFETRHQMFEKYRLQEAAR